ncbi:GIY-YIG nuclease family protein [Halorubrum ezzemoulense]|uniref:GIY-YIG nuclease family protein n=1 Tax=Halorubrum ezzemoulense TaxID=337243 RepID=A0ABT4Z1C1_HALEZ|nr:GIY-YIG nuclease family protein [Halorubrum ezzemoulense]MDB2244426.1 GIY-YIG nuclease family protein [Halorubrum ezzemoulense]MDB2250672.1 GIY-YIG nuclease family protein [Halorubrum ezzemoulense]MDB2278817.1 GIY-YIG nuclease family protein [Halorubrum ezzemoulense]MDB2285879.1 GIY-YIG nuclease family protein [Halorubrum ezzemoulense]MDB2287760.1 GIY-YIG nuclease family protein [Halorubrum ezzemoulense]
MTDADGGSYTLIVALAADATLSAGALGEHRLPAGAYAYTGSALGAGGFSRVDRHRRTARGDHDVRHWHVDYLLGHPAARIDRVVRSLGLDVECPVAERLPAGPVDGFGASDCDCPSHLAAGDASEAAEVSGPDRDALDGLAERALAAHEAAVAAAADPDATVEVVAGSGE